MTRDSMTPERFEEIKQARDLNWAHWPPQTGELIRALDEAWKERDEARATVRLLENEIAARNATIGELKLRLAQSQEFG